MSEAFFFGSDTPLGFYGLFSQLADPARLRKLYLLKGGAGGGKGTLLRKLLIAAEAQGHDCLALYCAADPRSLDGVYLPGLGVAVVDATNPHALEPGYWGVFEEIVPLFACLDTRRLAQRRAEIIALSDESALLHRQAQPCLAGAAALLGDTARLAREYTDLPKAQRAAERIAARELPETGRGRGGELKVFASAMTAEGLAEAPCCAPPAQRLIVLEDEYGVAAPLMLSLLREYALTAGYSIHTGLSALSPASRPAALFVPERGLGFIISHPLLRTSWQADTHINARRFTEPALREEHRARLRFNRRGAAELIGEAAGLLSRAADAHRQLEACYRGAVDFTLADLLAAELIRGILEPCEEL